jgi:hypothetical protein
VIGSWDLSLGSGFMKLGWILSFFFFYTNFVVYFFCGILRFLCLVCRRRWRCLGDRAEIKWEGGELDHGRGRMG